MLGRQVTQAAVAVALGAVVWIGTARAATETNLGQGPVDSRGAVGDLKLAQDLYQYGKQSKDALAVIVAARITASVPTTDKDRAKQEDAAKDETGAGKDKAAQAQPAVAKTDDSGPPQLDEMVSTAKSLAGDDKVLLAMIDEIGKTQSKGRVGGPGRTVNAASAGRTHSYQETFRGGELAEVAVVGDGDTDLDLFVYDENGNLICRDTDYTDRLYCRWYPRWTGPFIIRIANFGSVYNRYVIVTN